MGGSAGGNSNAQLFQLMSQYGGNGGARPQSTTKQRFNGALNAWLDSGAEGVFAPWAAIDGKSLGGTSGYQSGGRIGGGGGGKKNPKPPVNPPTQAEKFQWQFPQYTQTWAFTPPEPTPYMYPQPFNTNIFGNPLPKEKKK